MSSAASARGQAEAEASVTRKRENSSTPNAEKRVNCALDLHFLNCPICLDPFSSSSLVYQCPSAHTGCEACYVEHRKCPSCELPMGNIRSCVIENILKSLLVSCKHACHGCKKMLQRTKTEYHEHFCEYQPCRCPVPECTHECTILTLPQHLTEKHQVPLIAIDRNGEAVFKMQVPSDRYVMVKGDQHDTVLLVHYEANEPFGDVLFCTHFGTWNRICNLKVEYNLKLEYFSASHSIADATAVDVRRKREYWKGDFLLVPFCSKPLAPETRPYKLSFTVAPGYAVPDG